MDKSLSFFQNLHYSVGELSHVKEVVRESGKTIILPYDQFIEHDNRHIDPNPEAGNPIILSNLRWKADAMLWFFTMVWRKDIG